MGYIMITVMVCRNSTYLNECRIDDPALNWGSDISDALLVSEAVLVERGRIEIDTSYTNRNNIDLLLYQTNFIQPGTMIQTVEGDIVKNGMLKNITISFRRDDTKASMGSTMGIEQNV